MTYQTSWYIENVVLYIKFSGRMDLASYHGANTETVQHLNQSPGKVHILLDQTEITDTIISLSALKDTLSALRHPHLGWLITFGSQNRLFNFITLAMVQFFSIRYRNVEDMQAAVKFLQEVDDRIAVQ